MDKILVYIIAAALVTIALRALPYFLIGGLKEIPEWLDELFIKLPLVVMTVLLVYCFKGVVKDQTIIIPSLVAGLMTALSYKLKHNTMLSIVLGTIIYMGLLRIL